MIVKKVQSSGGPDLSFTETNGTPVKISSFFFLENTASNKVPLKINPWANVPLRCFESDTCIYAHWGHTLEQVYSSCQKTKLGEVTVFFICYITLQFKEFNLFPASMSRKKSDTERQPFWHTFEHQVYSFISESCSK